MDAIGLFKPTISEEAIQAAAAVMRTGWLGMGPQVEAFEREFAGALELPPHAVATGSCTAALHMAFRLLNLPAEAEVVTTPNTFVATNQVLLWEKLTPVFADIDPLTGNIDPRDVARKITPRTRAMLVVHFGGRPCDLSTLEAIAQKHDLALVEDAAHACGATYKGRAIGGHGHFTAFSFGPTKNLTTGDGGMLILPNDALLARARGLRNLGITDDIHRRLTGLDAGRVQAEGRRGRTYHWEYDVPAMGFRYHMNDITAAIGRAQLARLKENGTKRAVIAARYRELLTGIPGLRVPPPPPAEAESANYLFHVLAERRDALAEALQERGVTVSVHYRPSTSFPIFAGSGASVPHAEAFFERELSLPMHPELREEQVERVAGAIRAGW
jgi:perosamine synthetase